MIACQHSTQKVNNSNTLLLKVSCTRQLAKSRYITLAWNITHKKKQDNSLAPLRESSLFSFPQFHHASLHAGKMASAGDVV